MNLQKLKTVAISLAIILLIMPVAATIASMLTASSAEAVQYSFLVLIITGVVAALFLLASVTGIVLGSVLLAKRKSKIAATMFAISILVSISGITYMTRWIVAGIST